MHRAEQRTRSALAAAVVTILFVQVAIAASTTASGSPADVGGG
jgi:hypothetical protein